MAKNNQVLLIGGKQYIMDQQEDGRVLVLERVKEPPPKATG